MSTNNKIVKTLYRSSLRICSDLGFKYGSRNEDLILDLSSKTVTPKIIKRMKKRNILGEFLGNNLIYYYEIGRNDYDCNIDHNIDGAFEGYRYLTGLKYGLKYELSKF